jgi:hypothetical protein
VHFPRVICASLRWRHRGASTDPVDGLRLCSTSVAGSKLVYPSICLSTATDEGGR